MGVRTTVSWSPLAEPEIRTAVSWPRADPEIGRQVEKITYIQCEVFKNEMQEGKNKFELEGEVGWIKGRIKEQEEKETKSEN